MGSKAQNSSVPETSYFELQAYVGTTKHLGGFDTTRELIERCGVDGHHYVLDVGCGVGATSCYLAKQYGCKVMGVDLRESMIARANERAGREGVEDLVVFRVADAQSLPFDDGTFDVVFCESVVTFIADKQRVVNEFVRVTKPGGCVGLNEEIWLKPPPPELAERIKSLWGIESDVPTVEDWLAWLANAGLDVEHTVYEFNARREATQLKRYRPRDLLLMFYRMLVLYCKSAAFREYMKGRRRTPRDTFEYFGHALFVGTR